MQGDLYPSWNADYAWEERETPLNDGDCGTRFGSVTQLLFDGFQTQDQARSLGYEKLARYYDFHGAAQDIARATITVLFQQLVEFAEKISGAPPGLPTAERVAAGRDEGVNLEQATAQRRIQFVDRVTSLYAVCAGTALVPGDDLPMPLDHWHAARYGMKPRVAYEQSLKSTDRNACGLEALNAAGAPCTRSICAIATSRKPTSTASAAIMTCRRLNCSTTTCSGGG